MGSDWKNTSIWLGHGPRQLKRSCIEDGELSMIISIQNDTEAQRQYQNCHYLMPDCSPLWTSSRPREQIYNKIGIKAQQSNFFYALWPLCGCYPSQVPGYNAHIIQVRTQLNVMMYPIEDKLNRKIVRWLLLSVESIIWNYIVYINKTMILKVQFELAIDWESDIFWILKLFKIREF